MTNGKPRTTTRSTTLLDKYEGCLLFGGCLPLTLILWLIVIAIAGHLFGVLPL